MKKFNLHTIYTLGQRLADLDKIKQDDLIRDHSVDVFWALQTLDGMLLSESPLLETSKRAIRALKLEIHKVFPKNFQKTFDEEYNEKTVGWYATQITSSKSDLEKVLVNDMPGIMSYLVPQKGIYRTEDLVEHTEKQFPEKIQQHLGEQARLDIKQAGKCLAFGLPTACAFHLWRAVETVILDYYKALTGKDLAKMKGGQNWGAYIKTLEKTDNADPKIVAFLDNIRESYRNPHTHPGVTVNDDEALALFPVATGVIQQTVEQIRQAKENSEREKAKVGANPTSLLSNRGGQVESQS